ncbi:PAX-interacting protein 1 [Trichonephila clavipes]|nr:PAX-interacting protein 1 [Trichonephila clavipes]
MSSRHHIDDFMRGRIIGKIEEGRKITDVARECDIAHSVVSRLWKSFKTTGMCSRRHGEVVLEVRRLQKTGISSYQQKEQAHHSSADESRFSLSSDCRHQLIWHESGTAYRLENIQEKDRYPTCSIMVWAGIMINGRTCLHVVVNGTMTVQRYIDEVLLPHVRLFRGAVGDNFFYGRQRNMSSNTRCSGLSRERGRQVAGRNYPPTNKNTLIRALTEEWDKVPQQLLDNVVQTVTVPLSKTWRFVRPSNMMPTQTIKPSLVDLSDIGGHEASSCFFPYENMSASNREELLYVTMKVLTVHGRQPLRVVVVEDIMMEGMTSMQRRYHTFHKQKANHYPPFPLGADRQWSCYVEQSATPQ